MFISYNWLRELTETKLAPEELRERLTMVGLAIDAVERAGDDYVLDVEVPSNRPDCLSHVGIAREVATIEGGELIHPAAIPPTIADATAAYTAVEILDPDLCPRYAARLVRGVKIGPSPDWLIKRLEAIGQRPINNVADITNYVLHELGQPLHAFDLAKLREHRIVVRRAKPGEKIRTLDGADRELNPDMLIIADAQHPVALAGIMGGEESEISNQTTDVLIESAYFDPESVRRTARKLGMDTEASRRFERGVDFAGVVAAQNRCIELICDLAGGAATQAPLDVCKREPPRRFVRFHPARVEALTSLRVPVTEMSRILASLGFEEMSVEVLPDESPAMNLRVPTWRGDVSIEEDLVEEVARHSGYQDIGSELPPSNLPGDYQPGELQRRALRRALTAQGFDEAINFSFVDSRNELIEPLPEIAGRDDFVELSNPIIEGAFRMRTSLIPGLLTVLRHNLNHGQRDVRIFEIGRVFGTADKNQLPHEQEAMALIVYGGALEANRAESQRELDFFDLKGALEAAVDASRRAPLCFKEGRLRHLRPNQSALIVSDNGEVIGGLGRLAESIATTYKFRGPVYVAELDLTQLLQLNERPVHYKPLPRFPGVVRDVTLLVNRSTTFADIADAVFAERAEHHRDVRLLGTYEGENIPEGKRSVTLRLEYRSDERTLRDDEVEEMHRHVVSQVAQKFGAELH